MKITKHKNEDKQISIKSWFISLYKGSFRWIFMIGLIGFGLTAGFLYSWKFNPRTSVASTLEPGVTPVQIPPTAVVHSQEELSSLPVLQITYDEQELNHQSGNPIEAALNVNGLGNQAISINSMEQTNAGWNLSLLQEIPELTLNGNQFQLISTEADQVVSIWLYAKQMREAGIYVQEFIPVIASMNGKDESVYYLISMDQSADGFLFQLPEAFFSVKPYNLAGQNAILDAAKTSIEYYEPASTEKESDALLDYLSMLMRNPDEKTNTLDIPKFSSYFAIHDLWAAPYINFSMDPVYFYNVQSQKIEPAIADIGQIVLSGDRAEKSFPFSAHPIFEVGELQIAYLSALTQRASLDSFETLQQNEYAQFHAYEKQINDRLGTVYSPTWELLSFRHQMMRLQVDPPYPVRGFVYADPAGDCVHVSIMNLMVIPVDVENVSLLGIDVPLKLDWLQNPTGAAVLTASDEILRMAPFQNPDIFMEFCVPTQKFQQILAEQDIEDSLAEMLMKENIWMIKAHISGQEKSFAVAMIPEVPPQSGGKRDMPPIQSVEELSEIFPFIQANPEGDQLTFLSGSWQVKSDIVIPSGVSVIFEPGCELYFAPNAVLLSFSGFQAIGTESQPVLFSAMQETWPGMIMIDAEDESILEHVIVEKTGGIERGGWILTGGITFYRSPLVLRNSTLQDSVVEDAINVIRTTFTFDHLTIQRTPSDAFDSDFADGQIIGCHFEDIGGDAVDISGAKVLVSDTSMLNVADKGLSAGENSQITGENLRMENMGIGGAAKDLSTLVIKNSDIQNARVAGLAAYIKKSTFGPSSITAENVQIINTATETLVQTHSVVIWNGKEQDTQDLNVKTLYALGILGN